MFPTWASSFLLSVSKGLWKHPTADADAFRDASMHTCTGLIAQGWSKELYLVFFLALWSVLKFLFFSPWSAPLSHLHVHPLLGSCDDTTWHDLVRYRATTGRTSDPRLPLGVPGRILRSRVRDGYRSCQ